MRNTCLHLKIELERGVVLDRIGVFKAIPLSSSSFRDFENWILSLTRFRMKMEENTNNGMEREIERGRK